MRKFSGTDSPHTALLKAVGLPYNAGHRNADLLHAGNTHFSVTRQTFISNSITIEFSLTNYYISTSLLSCCHVMILTVTIIDTETSKSAIARIDGGEVKNSDRVTEGVATQILPRSPVQQGPPDTYPICISTDNDVGDKLGKTPTGLGTSQVNTPLQQISMPGSSSSHKVENLGSNNKESMQENEGKRRSLAWLPSSEGKNGTGSGRTSMVEGGAQINGDDLSGFYKPSYK